MRIQLEEIRAVSQCPRYNSLLKQVEHKSETSSTQTILNIFKECYIQIRETSSRPSWREIVGWVDTEVFRNLDVSNEETYEAGRRRSEHLLGWLSKWYNGVLLKESIRGYVNFAISQSIGEHEIYTQAPLIKLLDPPIVTWISSVVRSEIELYNDIQVRGLLWIVSSNLDSDRVKGQELFMGPQGGYQNTLIDVDRESHTRTKKMISQVIELIIAGIDYPSVTKRCIECPFRRRCKI